MTTNYLDSKKAATLLGVTERHVARMCTNDDLPGAVKNGSQWFIPVSAHPKLAAGGHQQKLQDSAELQNVPAGKRKDAIRKLGLIQDFERFAGAYLHNGGWRSEAVAVFTAQKKIPMRSFYRWLLHWLFLIESIVGILTLGFYSPTLVTPGCVAILDRQSRYVASHKE